MKVLQILPELNSGGVERGTLEIAAALIAAGHESLVVSNGGRLVETLEKAGSRHIAMPVHRKSLLTLAQVRPLRRLLEKERPDILHIRSRAPGWIAWLAWRGMDPTTRPRLVSTVHGFYSTNAYSAVMTRGERVIAVSNSIRQYILKHYPATEPGIIRVIHRGASPEALPKGYQPDAAWIESWRKAQPQLAGREVLLLPGRITRWKGQEHFVRLIAALKSRGRLVHGLLAGEVHPGKRSFADEIIELARCLHVEKDITLLGHRSDLREVMAVSDLVLSLSLDPEAFGRVSLEAMAIGKPVLAYDHGGVAEQLAVMFPRGAVPVGNQKALAARAASLLDDSARPGTIAAEFTLDAMCGSTLAVYEELLRSPRSAP